MLLVFITVINTILVITLLLINNNNNNKTYIHVQPQIMFLTDVCNLSQDVKRSQHS